jgi:hypothetical protein
MLRVLEELFEAPAEEEEEDDFGGMWKGGHELK